MRIHSGFIVTPPRFVEFKPAADLDDVRVPMTRCAWAEFVADNDFTSDEADALALEICLHGSARVGGGAAPLFYIRRG